MIKMNRTCLVLTLMFVGPLGAGGCDELSPEEGVFVCNIDADCPSAWVCDQRGEPSQRRCWQQSVPSIDASTTTPPLTSAEGFDGTPGRSGGRSYPDLDAATQYTCGDWKYVRHFDVPPPNAEALGHEADPLLGQDRHYLCKFKVEIEGRPTMLQGKAAFGYGCFGVAPATPTVPAHRRESSDFYVLVDTRDCARMGPFDPNLRLMPTGSDGLGAPTYSCRAHVPSAKVSGQEDLLLGRFDPDTRVCSFAVGEQVAQQTERVDALMVP